MSLREEIPELYEDGAREATRAIAGLDHVLLAAHVNLDGDALGSLAACGYILRDLGKKFAIYSSSGIPDYLSFLELPGSVYVDLATLPFEPEAAIYLDCGECSRLGSQLRDACRDLPSVNVDHHLSDGVLGTLANFVNPAAASTSQLVAYVAMELGAKLAGPLADAVALGLITDTGGFCHCNTNADVFALSAILARAGCSFSRLREKLANNWSLSRLRLWGELFLKVKILDRGRTAFCAVTLEDLKKRDCGSEDLEGLVEWLRKIRGVKVAALLREENDGVCKFSLRSEGAVDARSMAAFLGGGGHFNAAGGAIAASPDEAAKILENAVSRGLDSVRTK